MAPSALLLRGNLEADARLCFSSHINTTNIHTNHSIGKALSLRKIQTPYLLSVVFSNLLRGLWM